jgi:hypothetical protein
LSEIELETFINLLFAQKHIVDPSKYEDLRSKIIEAKKTELFRQVFNAEKLQEYVDEDIPNLKMDLILSAQITPILSSGLKGNPRQCKRFLNTLLLRMQMASSKGINIEKRILVKIMLLEAFNPDAFEKIQNNLDGETGRFIEIEALEKFSEKEENPLPEQFNDWVEDDWLKKWLEIEPTLVGIDLRPYFYFSRDNLNLKKRLFGIRISEEVQNLIKDLLSTSDALIKKSMPLVEKLSSNEAQIIFNELSEKVYQEEKNINRAKLIKVCIEFVKTKPEFKPELIKFLMRIPEKQLMASVVPSIVGCFQDSQQKAQMMKLLEKWKINSTNSKLATAAEKTIPKIK